MRVERWGSRGLLFCVALLLSVALPSAASAACAPGATLAKYDDEVAMLNGGGGGYVQDSQWIAQEFVSAGSQELGSVSLFVENQLPTGDAVIVSVRSDGGAGPGTILGEAAASTTNTTSFDWLTVDFEPLGLQLTAGTHYWIVASNTSLTSGAGYAWQQTAGGIAYPDGISKVSTNRGANWTTLNEDYGFRVLTCAPPTVPTDPPTTDPPTTDPPVTDPPAAPSNAFTLGATERNKKKGTATLNITLPNPGQLTASGNGVTATSGGQPTIGQAFAAGAAPVLIKANGSKKAKLKRTGKVNVEVAITYTPTNGTASTQTASVKLEKR